MSSAAYLTFHRPITRTQWAKFCTRHDVRYSPNTVGRNIFYWRNMGEVEISFGEKNFEQKPEGEQPIEDFKVVDYPAILGEAHCGVFPPESASRITCSSFYGRNLKLIAQIVGEILTEFDGKWSADPEVALHLQDHAGRRSH